MGGHGEQHLEPAFAARAGAERSGPRTAEAPEQGPGPDDRGLRRRVGRRREGEFDRCAVHQKTGRPVRQRTGFPRAAHAASVTDIGSTARREERRHEDSGHPGHAGTPWPAPGHEDGVRRLDRTAPADQLLRPRVRARLVVLAVVSDGRLAAAGLQRGRGAAGGVDRHRRRGRPGGFPGPRPADDPMAGAVVLLRLRTAVAGRVALRGVGAQQRARSGVDGPGVGQFRADVPRAPGQPPGRPDGRRAGVARVRRATAAA